MERLKEQAEELKKQVAEAEATLKRMARQNTDYNAEIMRLKSVKEAAEKDAANADASLAALNDKVAVAKQSLDAILKDSAQAKERFESLKKMSSDAIASLDKDKNALIMSVTGLMARKEGLSVEIANLSTQSSSTSVTLNTTKFSVSEAEGKLRKLKSDIAIVQRDLETTNDELTRKFISLNEAKKEYETITETTREKAEALEGLIDAKEKELLNIQDAIDAKLRKLNIEIKDKEAELIIREEKIKEFEIKNNEDSQSLSKLREALELRGKELKLFELKLRDAAKKKDIDLQLTNLM